MGRVQELYEQLNAKTKEERLAAVRELKEKIDSGVIQSVDRIGECNNHVHSKYSFSPYSPAMIAWKAYKTGLDTCGIVDHESVAGCKEFAEACRILGVVPTLGFEVRMCWDNTPLKGKKFNNPDQLSVGYFPIHGVPVSSLEKVDEFLAPIRKAREKRNREMTKKVDAILKQHGLALNFEQDVVPVSYWNDRGSITERHILFATGLQIIEAYGKGAATVDFLENSLNIPISDKARGFLMDVESPIYEYDLTNILKGFFSEYMYVDATPEETPYVEKAVPFLNSLGCIATYTYLGDVLGESVTGDKKTQKFEDDILDDLFKYGYEYGLRGFSYAPTRNSKEQVERVRDLCRKYQMVEICGEDINQPRQSFIVTQKNEEDRLFFNDSTWAVIGHEMMADKSLEDSIISEKTQNKFATIEERIAYYKKIALEKS